MRNARAGRLAYMTADALELISVDPLVSHGQACLNGTRIPVSAVLDCLGDRSDRRADHRAVPVTVNGSRTRRRGIGGSTVLDDSRGGRSDPAIFPRDDPREPVADHP